MSDRVIVLRNGLQVAVPRHYASGIPFEYIHGTDNPGAGKFSIHTTGGGNQIVFSNTDAAGHDLSLFFQRMWGGLASFSLPGNGSNLGVIELRDGSKELVHLSSATNFEQGVNTAAFDSSDDGAVYLVAFMLGIGEFPEARALTLLGSGGVPGEIYFQHYSSSPIFGISVRPKTSPGGSRLIEFPDKSGDLIVIPTPASGDILYYDGTDWQKLAKRANGTTLQLSGGFPAWVAPPSAVPVASVMPYAGTTAPSDWMLCHGQAISRTTYAALFTAVGTNYGAGNGSTTFNLPDLRGRVVAGKDDMGGSAASRITTAASGITGTTLGASGGVQEHPLTSAESGVPAHTHHVGGGQGTVSRGTGAAVTASQAGGASAANAAADAVEAHINVQPTMILNHIIRVNP